MSRSALNGVPAPTKTGEVGLRHVAARAGISVATASAVLSPTRSNTRVSEETRARVLQTARELNYHPNALARALTGQPTRTLGVLFGLERASVAVANPYFFTVLQGIVASAAEAGYNVTLFTEPWHDAARSSGVVRDRRTDGVVALSPTTDGDIISSLVRFGIPVVAVGGVSDGLAPCVDVDNAEGARLAVKHLLSLGHTRIAHITGDLNLGSGVARQNAFLAALTEASIVVPSDYIVPGQYTPDAGYKGTIHLLDLPHPPTAIFAASDEIARGVLLAAREKKVVVPAQLSVIGFNGLPMQEPFDPPLTTIRQPLDEIGKQAARLLLQTIGGAENAPEARAYLFAPELIIRETTSAPAPGVL